MYTVHHKNNRGNGWGLNISHGKLCEFGYYENSVLKNNLSDFADWYFTKMMNAGRNDNMLSIYTYNQTHEVADLLIGYKGDGFQCYMGFHFMSDGSVWVGTTSTRNMSGELIHFRPDGLIDAGSFENGNLIERKKLQEIIDDYYGTWDFSDDLFASDLLSKHKTFADIERESTRNEFKNIMEIVVGHNYFNGLPQAEGDNLESDETANNYTMNFHLREVDTNANGNFQRTKEEIWKIGDESIETPHGNLEIYSMVEVDNGQLVGVQLDVFGNLSMDSFDFSNGLEEDIEIGTIAVLRQPHNVWLWIYAFDCEGQPIANFCGNDDIDGLLHFISKMKRLGKL